MFRSILFSALRRGARQMLVRRSTHSFTGWVAVFVFDDQVQAQGFADRWGHPSHHGCAVRLIGGRFHVSVPVHGFPRRFCTLPWLSLGLVTRL